MKKSTFKVLLLYALKEQNTKDSKVSWVVELQLNRLQIEKEYLPNLLDITDYCANFLFIKLETLNLGYLSIFW